MPSQVKIVRDKQGVDMCKNHGHGRLISDIHSTAQRELCRRPDIPVQDDGSVRSRRAELNEKDKDSLLALGDALAYQMRYNEALEYYGKARNAFPNDYECHRKCGARYLSVLDISSAQREFLWCLKRTDDELDIRYRLALCAYYSGDYDTALLRFEECYALCKNNGEMYVAVLYWHIQCLVRLGRSVKPALERCCDRLDCGHHIGYMQTVRLFMSGEENIESVIENDDELNLSIYRYGYYAYLLYNGRKDEAARELDAVLELNTYFSSFAYLGAYAEKQRLLKRATEKLRTFFREQKRIALAFSGGTDSAYLLSEAVDVGADFKAYFVRTGFQPQFELDDAIRLAKEMKADFEIIEVNALSDKLITANDGERCYRCKRAMLAALKQRAANDGYEVIIDGTNASDDISDRPGYRALCEMGVCSPLRECGLSKSDVRELSRRRGLFTRDKPSYSCLATRICRGEEITAEALERIERAETFLNDMGYYDFRVRYADRCAKIEIKRGQNNKFQTEKHKIFAALSQYFDRVEQSDILR
ncbi:MAG: ATP-dependent sacrificial sulfur transferase LarE [Clostridia bacterium]|mgnify:FL=1|jgi:uncharacterized protein|nr:ATP-dependent sacrificial sulfur transferase LarE [Clostridia bacterium]